MSEWQGMVGKTVQAVDDANPEKEVRVTFTDGSVAALLQAEPVMVPPPETPAKPFDRVAYARRVLNSLQQRGDWGKCFGIGDLEIALWRLKQELVFQDRLAGFLAGTPALQSASAAEAAKLLFAYLDKIGVLNLNKIKTDGYQFTHIKD